MEEQKDNKVEVVLDLPLDVYETLVKNAKELDISLDELVERILLEYIEKYKYE